jgi:hypothetical protein
MRSCAQAAAALFTGAKTTPHMFVIDKNGALQYMGTPYGCAVKYRS